MSNPRLRILGLPSGRDLLLIDRAPEAIREGIANGGVMDPMVIAFSMEVDVE